MITVDQLRAMARGRAKDSNMQSVAVALNAHGRRFGLDRPHRLAHFLGQLLHESGSFQFDRELWGPTAQQKKYDTGRLARQLGNTPQADGDGALFKGRTPGMITGRANYRNFTEWAREIDADAPDFERDPDAILTDPWEGLGPIWYWDSGNPERRSLNRYADDNNIEMITLRINGGKTGYADRLVCYGRAALVLAGYGTSIAEIKRFQRDHSDAGPVDGIVGQRTRMALHKALKGANPFEERVPVPVDRPTVPRQVDEEVEQKTGLWGWTTTLFGGGGAGGAMLFGMQWQTVAVLAAVALIGVIILVVLGPQIVRSIRRIRQEIEGRTA